MDFEEANSQVDSLCGALPRDDLRMHKCIKSDISKVMYQMKCMDPLHASPTFNLSDPNHEGAQWLSGRVLDSRPKGRGFEPHRRHCVVVLEQDTFILA